jgi:chromosome segregation ATPase
MSHKQRLSNGSKTLEALAPDCHAQNNSAIQKLEALFSLAGSFASDQEAKKVISVFQETSNLLDSTHRKDNELAAQKAKMEAMEKKHKDFREQQIEGFEMAQIKLRAKLGDFEAKILDLTRDVAQKNSIVDKLKDSNAKSEYETEQLQKLAASQKARAEADSAKIDKLENLCKKARDENTSLCEQLQKEKEQQTRLKSAHGTLQQKFDTVQREHNSIEQRWQLAQSLRVELSDEEPETLYVTLPVRWWAL